MNNSALLKIYIQNQLNSFFTEHYDDDFLKDNPDFLFKQFMFSLSLEDRSCDDIALDTNAIKENGHCVVKYIKANNRIELEFDEKTNIIDLNDRRLYYFYEDSEKKLHLLEERKYYYREKGNFDEYKIPDQKQWKRKNIVYFQKIHMEKIIFKKTESFNFSLDELRSVFEPYKDNLLAEKGEFEEILDKDIKFDIKFIYKCCNIVNGIKQESKKNKIFKVPRRNLE